MKKKQRERKKKAMKKRMAAAMFYYTFRLSVSCSNESLSEEDLTKKFREFIDKKLIDVEDFIKVRISAFFTCKDKKIDLLFICKKSGLESTRNIVENFDGEIFKSEVVETETQVKKKFVKDKMGSMSVGCSFADLVVNFCPYKEFEEDEEVLKEHEAKAKAKEEIEKKEIKVEEIPDFKKGCFMVLERSGNLNPEVFG